MALNVLDVNDLVGTGVVFDVHEHTDTTNIVSALNKDLGSVLKLDNAVNFTSLKVKLRTTNDRVS